MKVYRRRRKPRSNLHLLVMAFLILLILVILVSSFIVLVVNNNRRLNDLSAMAKFEQSSSSQAADVKPIKNSTSNTKPSSGTSANTNTSSSGSVVESDGVTVKKSKLAPMSYFDDALFIGDSISEGFKLYQVLPPSNVLANQSVGADHIARDKPVYVTSKGKITLKKALENRNPKKIYLLLGTNGIPGYSNAAHIVYYEQVVDFLVKKYPSAIIYLQSLTPVTTAKSKVDKNLNNKKITDFNKRVKAIAKKKNLYYLDVASALKDKNGGLKTSLAGGDGVHFKKQGHEEMLKYYRYHTVTASKKAAKVKANTPLELE